MLNLSVENTEVSVPSLNKSDLRELKTEGEIAKVTKNGERGAVCAHYSCTWR
jgi:hypothetical protein